MVLYGAASGRPDPVPIQKIQPRSLYLTRPQLHHYTATREELLERAREVFEWVREGKLKVEIGGRYPLEEAPARARGPRVAPDDREAHPAPSRRLSC
jgi:NADPH2:quinone reductase